MIGEQDLPQQIDFQNPGIDDQDVQDDVTDDNVTQGTSNMTESSMDSEAASNFNRENWIRMASYPEFAQFMSIEFGDDNFNLAFKAVNENKQLVYSDDGNYQQLL